MSEIQLQIEELAGRVRLAGERQNALHIRGGGSKEFFTGPPPETSEVIDCKSYNGIVSYEPSELVISVRAGTSLKAVESMLASRGQQFPFDPPSFSPNTTVGGMVASGFAGSRRPYAGAVRDAVLGVKMINGKGEVLQFGGQVIKNVAGYDVSRLMAGSFGTLGIILEVSLKVVPKPSCELTFEKPVQKDRLFTELKMIRQACNNLTGLASDGENIVFRLAGSEKSISQIADRLGGRRTINAESYWRSLKDHQQKFFDDDKPLWRISLPPACGELDVAGESLIDWGGALRWLKTEMKTDDIQDAVKIVGGNAILFRSPDKNGMQFSRLSPAVLGIHQRIKHSFDPKSILNSNYLFPGMS